MDDITIHLASLWLFWLVVLVVFICHRVGVRWLNVFFFSRSKFLSISVHEDTSQDVWVSFLIFQTFTYGIGIVKSWLITKKAVVIHCFLNKAKLWFPYKCYRFDLLWSEYNHEKETYLTSCLTSSAYSTIFQISQNPNYSITIHQSLNKNTITYIR